MGIRGSGMSHDRIRVVKHNLVLVLSCLGVALGLVSCGSTTDRAAAAGKMVAAADTELLALSNQASQAQWIAATYITQDSEAISAALTAFSAADPTFTTGAINVPK